MSLRHAILVLLDEKPASGYDLAQEFAHSMGYVWNATHQQIYLELNKMSAKGWVEHEVVAQKGRPDKKVYQITKAGIEHLTQWLNEPASLTRIRDSLLIKLAGGALVAPDNLQEEIAHHRKHYKSQLELYERLHNRYQKFNEESQKRYFFRHLTLRRAILSTRAWLDWAEEVQEHLKDFASAS